MPRSLPAPCQPTPASHRPEAKARRAGPRLPSAQPNATCCVPSLPARWPARALRSPLRSGWSVCRYEDPSLLLEPTLWVGGGSGSSFGRVRLVVVLASSFRVARLVAGRRGRGDRAGGRPALADG